jgi:hypothetical protein
MVLAAASPARAQVAAPAPETVAIGDWALAPVVDVRARGEYRHDLDDEDLGTLVERARLGVAATRGPVALRVVLQDARTLDLADRPAPVGGPPAATVTGAYEAWADAHTDDVRPSFVRVGRQVVVWGEGRLLGDADWTAAGRSLDAVRARWSAGDVALEGLAAVLTEPQTGAALDAYGELFGLRAEWAFDPLFAVEAYGLARIAQGNPLASLDGTVRGQTYAGALRLHGDWRPWAWGAEGAYELGHVDELAAARAAWAAAGHVAFTFERILGAPALGAGVSYASGDAGGGPGATHRTFDPLLPDVHTWHGAMQLFSWSNEAEVSGRVSAVPWTDGLATIEYRYARLAESEGAWRSAYLTTIGRATKNGDADLGHEIDASLRWSPWPPVALEGGYSLFLLGGGARAILAQSAVGPVPPSASPGALSPVHVSQFAYAQVGVALR